MCSVRSTEQGQGYDATSTKGLQRVPHIFTLDHPCTLPDSLAPHTVIEPLAHIVGPPRQMNGLA